MEVNNHKADMIFQSNVLIIGKSGVGKSSVLNYLVGSKIAETGSGKPVTEKEQFQTEKIVLKNNLTINITDTWGLEADKSNEWKDLIVNEVKKHNKCEKISDWFHTILYCISAKSARIEEFETEIIKELISNGNKVIVILTHADTNNVEESIKNMTQILNESIGIDLKNIIPVCNISKNLLGGRKTKTFGKDEVLRRIRENLWESICIKLPIILKEDIRNELDTWYDYSCLYVDEKVKWFNYHSDKIVGQINLYLMETLEATLKKINKDINKKVKETYEYYFELNERIKDMQEDKSIHIDYEENIAYVMDFEEKLIENVTTAVLSLIPFGLFFTVGAFAEGRRDNIKSELKETVEKLNNRISEEIDRIMDEIGKVN